MTNTTATATDPTPDLLNSPASKTFIAEMFRAMIEDDINSFIGTAGPNDATLMQLITGTWRNEHGEDDGPDDILAKCITKIMDGRSASGPCVSDEEAESTQEEQGDIHHEAADDNPTRAHWEDPAATGIERDQNAFRRHLCSGIDAVIEKVKERASVADLMILRELLHDHESFAYPDKCCFPYLMETVL